MLCIFILVLYPRRDFRSKRFRSGRYRHWQWHPFLPTSRQGGPLPPTLGLPVLPRVFSMANVLLTPLLPAHLRVTRVHVPPGPSWTPVRSLRRFTRKENIHFRTGVYQALTLLCGHKISGVTQISGRTSNYGQKSRLYYSGLGPSTERALLPPQELSEGSVLPPDVRLRFLPFIVRSDRGHEDPSLQSRTEILECWM